MTGQSKHQAWPDKQYAGHAELFEEYNPPQIPRLKNPDSAPPVRVFRAYSAPVPRRPACSHGGRGPARSRVRAPPRRALPRRADFCNDYITVTKTVTLTKKVMAM